MNNEFIEWFRQQSDFQKETSIISLFSMCSENTLENLHKHISSRKVDFLSKLPIEVSKQVLKYLSAKELAAVEQTCKKWSVICHKLNQPLWENLCRKRGWDPKYHAFRPLGRHSEKSFFRYKSLVQNNWENGNYNFRIFRGHARSVFAVQMEGRFLFSSSFDCTIKVWDLGTGDCISTLKGHDAGVSCIRWHNGILVSGSSDSTLRVWNPENGECLNILSGHGEEVTSVFHDGITAISGSCDRTLKIWNLKTGLVATLNGHEDYVISVQFDDDIIVSGSYDSTVKVWDFKTHKVKYTLIGHKGGVKCVKFDKNIIVSSGSDKTILVWGREDGVLQARLTGHTQEVWYIQLLQTGYGNVTSLDRLVSAGRDGVRIWSSSYQQLLHIEKSVIGGVTCLDLDPCTIVASSFDKTIKLLDFNDYTEEVTCSGCEFESQSKKLKNEDHNGETSDGKGGMGIGQYNSRDMEVED